MNIKMSINKITRNNIDVSFSCTNLPSDATSSTASYVQRWKDENGNTTITGGKKYICKILGQAFKEEIDETTQISIKVKVAETTATFIVYTQPDIFSWKDKDEGKLKSGPNGDIVNNSSFMNKWNDLCEVAGQYRSWQDQDNEYSDYDSCMYKKNQLMSASKFNTIATALDKEKSFQVKKDDLITAKLFNDLIEKVKI